MKRLVTLAALFLAAALPLRAGDYHHADRNNCSDCHAQHASAHENLFSGAAITQPNGAPGDDINAYAPEQPSANAALLKTDDVCLSCHDGSRPAMGAPSVIAPVAFDAAAGFFEYATRTSSAHAHNLDGSPAVPPGRSDGTTMVLRCTTCHDPHGNGSYRNLRPNPFVRAVTGVTVVALQKVSGGDPADVYVGRNIIDKSGVSAWCNTCHADAPEAACPGPQQHAINKALWNAPGANYAYWSGVIAERVRVESPSDNSIPSTDDRVICVSCHKAHGSGENDAVVHADMSATGPICQQCHYSGSGAQAQRIR